jgi:hypothetical protein
MNRKTASGLLTLLTLVVGVPACREDTSPPASLNENLARAGEPALLPLAPQHFPSDVRGRLTRMDREERESGAAGEASGDQPSPAADEVLQAIEDFNRLIRGGDYASVPELVVAEQRDAALQYWSQLGELSLAVRDALSKATEAVGAARPDLMPRVEALKEQVDRLTVRGLVTPQVRSAGDETIVTVEPPAPPGLAAPDAAEITLRRGPEGWRFVAAIAADAEEDALIGPLSTALEQTEEAADAFESTEIDVETFLTRLEAAVGVASGQPPAAETGEAAAASQPEETPEPPAPAEPPTARGPADLVP